MKIMLLSSFMQRFRLFALLGFLSLMSCTKDIQPNLIIIYVDDLGYGDISCYGATEISTPHIDELAANGLMFTNAHCPSATCTPSRYAMLTGEYAWRREGTGIARGDAGMIIEPGRMTLAKVFREAGYITGVIGKWHLGLGPEDGPDWNSTITPGPVDIGFDYSFLIPATGDRVPCVFVENGKVVGLDPDDPIKVSYTEPILEEPTGKDHPELLKMHPSHGHNQTIINGISRIGYMSGGKSARWVDENIADTITTKAVQFIEENAGKPFFLYFATHDIHVPRVPHPGFAGKSGLSPRGDVILQLDWCVSTIMEKLGELHLTENTMVIFTSDNGPVLDDGYEDQAVELQGGHMPSGPFRGGKYSAFEAGTRIPFIVYWPGKVQHGKSDALIGQVDFISSFAGMVGVNLDEGDGPDSRNLFDVLTGKTEQGRDHLVEHNVNGTLSLVKGNWKYIEPSRASRINRNTNIELGNDTVPQLYNLDEDIGEKNNLAKDYPEKVEELSSLLDEIRGQPDRLP
jgi:arylsulfatase A-like enzyme